MRRILLFLLATGLMLSSAGGVALAQAQSSTTTSHGSFEPYVLSDQCTGEDVEISGQITLVGHYTVDANGGVHGSGVFHITGTGIGSSGTKYELVDTSGNSQNQNFNGATEDTGTGTFLLISDNGTGNNLINATFHITFNPDGTITAFVSSYTYKCT